jgi:hypothetical protein
MSGIYLVSPHVAYQQLGVRLSRHRGRFSSWDENNSGPVRSKEYDLFVDRVGGNFGWSQYLARNERRICESTIASRLSRRQCGLLFALVRRIRPVTISFLADVFLIVPAVVEVFG